MKGQCSRTGWEGAGSVEAGQVGKLQGRQGEIWGDMVGLGVPQATALLAPATASRVPAIPLAMATMPPPCPPKITGSKSWGASITSCNGKERV